MFNLYNQVLVKGLTFDILLGLAYRCEYGGCSNTTKAFKGGFRLLRFYNRAGVSSL